MEEEQGPALAPLQHVELTTVVGGHGEVADVVGRHQQAVAVGGGAGPQPAGHGTLGGDAGDGQPGQSQDLAGRGAHDGHPGRSATTTRGTRRPSPQVIS